MTSIAPPAHPSFQPPFAGSSIPPVEPDLRPPERPARGRIRRLALVVLAVAMIGGGLWMDRGGLAVVPILFLLVVPFEKMFPRHRQRLRRPQVGTDIGYALAGPLLSAVGIIVAAVVAIVSLAWLPGLALRPLVGMIPPAMAPFVGIALFDLAIYWTHRWYHEVPILWRFHAIHHSPDHMDWISGFRNHPFDGTLIAPAFIFLIAAGFTAEFTGVLAIIQFVLGIFLHANVRWRLRPLHRIVITPEFHHWHHANEPGAINSNYSVFLPAWDMIFGTYFMPKGRRPQVYGVSEHIPSGMAAQLWHPLRGLGNPLRAIVHPIRAMKAAFRFTWRLLKDMKRSATRRRRRSPEDFGPAYDPPTLDELPPPTTPPLSTAPPAGRQAPMPPPMAFAGPAPAPTTPYSPYFAGPGPGYPPTAVMPSPGWVEPEPRPTPLAEIMDWDDRA